VQRSHNENPLRGFYRELPNLFRMIPERTEEDSRADLSVASFLIVAWLDKNNGHCPKPRFSALEGRVGQHTKKRENLVWSGL
jgi:hypothetical protein